MSDYVKIALRELYRLKNVFVADFTASDHRRLMQLRQRVTKSTRIAARKMREAVR